MVSSAHGGQPFHVVYSATIAQTIRELQRRASRQDRGEEFLAAVRTVWGRLRDDPTSFGEALYRLPTLRLCVRCALMAPLGIHFAVHDDLPIVFVSSVKLLSKRGS
jgi:hypothetical protein